MRALTLPLAVLLGLALSAGCSPDPTDGDADADSDADSDTPQYSDEDGDCLADGAEGRTEGTDSDGDGTPDYLDDDSDGDGIADSVEAQSPDCDTTRPPVDSDNDGIPDFRDLDSDGNGLPDRDEGADDLDADGTPDFADLDDDGDYMSDADELGPDPADPSDADGDGTPDYHDTDSDNDTILDMTERGADSDGDGLPDYVDPDADNDGLLDSEEAGDTDPTTPARDTDGDLIPDFRDEDSDNDGLTDAWEVEHRDEYGTDPYLNDTDGDGVSDMIEVAAGTDPTDGTDDPRSRGHFVFLIPYEEEPDPPRDSLAFSTSLQLGDVFIVLDTTGSMSTELTSIRSELTQVIENVTCGPGEVPTEFNPCIPDLWVGFAWFTDVGDGHALTVEHNLTDDYESVIASMPTTTGGGWAEAQRKAAYCTVNGPGDPYCPTSAVQNNDEWPCAGPGIGFPCFRPDAARMLVLVTDETMDEDPIPDFDTVAEELMSAQLTFIGINAEASLDAAVSAHLTEIAVRSGSFDEWGAPLVYLGSDDTVDETVATAIGAVARVPLDVTARPHGNVEGEVDPAYFIESLETNALGGGACSEWPDVRDDDGDGIADTFIQIEPGTPVCWDLDVRMNDIVPPTREPQMFTATIEVRGGAGGTLLDSRDVFFLVPSETYIPPPD